MVQLSFLLMLSLYIICIIYYFQLNNSCTTVCLLVQVHVLLFHTAVIGVDLAQYEIFRAKACDF